MSTLNKIFIQSELLNSVDYIEHGFFGRKGGTSTGIYESLNINRNSNDNPENLEQNRAIVQQALGCKSLTTPKQTHSTTTHVITQKPDVILEGDSLITSSLGCAVGVSTADCCPILFAATDIKLVAAVHAGWRGSFDNIMRVTIEKMEALGASAAKILCAIGPCINRDSYGVDREFLDNFLNQSLENKKFFTQVSENEFLFDMQEYNKHQMFSLGVKNIDVLNVDTFANPDKYFSYRYSLKQGNDSYGTQCSAIFIK